MTHHNTHSVSGFALLITLLVVTVVVSVTLAVIELSLKQLALAVTAKDSEVAFYAANAGMECARYAWRTASSSFQNIGNSIANSRVENFRCFGRDGRLNLAETPALSVNSGSDGKLYRYQGQVDWGTNDRCSYIDMVFLVVPETDTSDMQVNGFSDLYPGFAEGDVKTCAPGSTCVVTQVTGHNRPCSQIPGTVRREILLEF